MNPSHLVVTGVTSTVRLFLLASEGVVFFLEVHFHLNAVVTTKCESGPELQTGTPSSDGEVHILI